MVTHGSGSYLFGLRNGKEQRVLDFTCGIGVTNLGHSHPRVVEAATAQLSRVTHVQSSIAMHDQMAQLMERMHEVMPQKSLDTFIFANSGAEAVENAIKIARYATVLSMLYSSYERTNIGKAKGCGVWRWVPWAYGRHNGPDHFGHGLFSGFRSIDAWRSRFALPVSVENASCSCRPFGRPLLARVGYCVEVAGTSARRCMYAH